MAVKLSKEEETWTTKLLPSPTIHILSSWQYLFPMDTRYELYCLSRNLLRGIKSEGKESKIVVGDKGWYNASSQPGKRGVGEPYSPFVPRNKLSVFRSLIYSEVINTICYPLNWCIECSCLFLVTTAIQVLSFFLSPAIRILNKLLYPLIYFHFLRV